MKKTTKKYELTTTIKYIMGGEKHQTSIEIYQIKALKDFGDVKKGDLGGYIQSEGNLSQEGNSWVDVGGIVFGDHRVCNNITIKRGVVVSPYNRCNDSGYYNRNNDWDWDDIITLASIFVIFAALVIFAIVGMVCLVS